MPSAYSFFCQHHIGKILSSTQNLKRFDSHHYATFAHITESTTKNGACSLHLPWSKTQKAWGDNIWIPHQEAPLDPIHALHKHFMKNKLKTNHPIVAYHNEPNNILTLTWSKFVCHINKILRAARKDYLLYLRSLLLNWGNNLLSYLRWPPDTVKKFGWWCSQAFLEYWHCLNYLGAIHIEMLPLKPQTHQMHPREAFLGLDYHP